MSLPNKKKPGTTHKTAIDEVFTLFHQTDLACAELIISSQTMKPGTGGLYGPGIYFANTIEATDLKCHRRGVYLIADVSLGKTIKISKEEAASKQVNIHQLQAKGYDSITGHHLHSGREYVVFRPDQVKNIKYVYGIRPKAIFSCNDERIVLFFVTNRKTAEKIVESQNMIKSDGKFGRAYYMYDTIADALAQRPNEETYLMAEVYMENFCRLPDDAKSIYDQHEEFKTFMGKASGMNIFIIKYKNLIQRIHYCGGKPWKTGK